MSVLWAVNALTSLTDRLTAVGVARVGFDHSYWRRELPPPKCPELNPIENLWQFMRDNRLSNRIFASYDDIGDHCYFA